MALSIIDGELERGWSGKMTLSWSMAVQQQISPPTIPSWTPLDVHMLLLFSPSLPCCSATLLLFCSSVHRAWGLEFIRVQDGGRGRPNVNFWMQKQECLFPLRAMGFQAWGWGFCWESNLFYPVFPCLLLVSLSDTIIHLSNFSYHYHSHVCHYFLTSACITRWHAPWGQRWTSFWLTLHLSCLETYYSVAILMNLT